MEKIETRLEKFISGFDLEKFCREVAQNANGDAHDTATLLDTYLNEAKSNFYVIAPYLKKNIRILEIGSGIGILTAFLKSEGYNILGIEPGEEGGFSFMSNLHKAILSQVALDMQPEILPISAVNLDPDIHGTFDLIFSINVIEHIFPLDDALQAMATVLAESGRMRHLCPNYQFPFEPHLGIPLVPFFPKTTRFLLSNIIKRNQSIWDGVNFVTASEVKNLASQNGLSSEFERGVMARFFGRLQDDTIFAERHRGIITQIAKMPFTGKIMMRVFQLIPPTLATPMIMTLMHDKNRH